LRPIGRGVDVLELPHSLGRVSWPKLRVQQRDPVQHPAKTGLKSLYRLIGTTLSVQGTERLKLSGRHPGNQAIRRGPGAFSGPAKLPQQRGIERRHVAGDNQVPLPGCTGVEHRFHSPQGTRAQKAIRNHRIAQCAVNRRIANQMNRARGLPHLIGNMLCKSTAGTVQERLIVAHPGALSAHQNEARKAHSRIHQEMIPLHYVTNCLRLARQLSIFAVLLAGLSSAEPMATRTTVVVRADTRTGRLVRSVVVGPTAVTAPEIAAPAIFMQASTQPAATESITASSLTELIDAIAAENNVEAPLVHSVIKAESNYNPAAISPKGAQGLMQLIPSTARRFGVFNSFNVQQNIEGGVRYLKFLMDLYHNDYVRVIAAYNAGEGAVAKYGGIPPYSETVNYVLRVGRNLKTARQFAELRAAERKPTPQPVETASHVAAESHSIQAITGDDGRIYYKTQ